MRHEQATADGCSQAAQVGIGPGGHHVAIKAGCLALGIPGEAEAVGVDGGMAAQGGKALADQRVAGPCHHVLEIDRLADPGR